VPDFKPHRFEFAAQLMIPETQHLDALLGEEPIALFIPSSLIWKTVSATIEFDRKLCDGTVEIQEVDAARILAAELEFVETMVTQQTPQALLGVSGFGAELAGEIASSGSASAMFAVLWRSPPHPNPLPRWGRGDFARVTVWVHVRCLVHGLLPKTRHRGAEKQRHSLTRRPVLALPDQWSRFPTR